MTRLAIKILLLGGLAGVAAAGAAGASPASSDVPALAVRFNSEMLATDSGARALYRRLARAASPAQPGWFPRRWRNAASRPSPAQSIRSTISGSPQCMPATAPNRVEE